MIATVAVIDRSLNFLILVCSLPSETFGFVFFQRLLRFFYTCGKRSLGKGLKVNEHGIAPVDCIAFLNRQFFRHFRVTLSVDHPGKRLPLLMRCPHPIDPTLVMQSQFIP